MVGRRCMLTSRASRVAAANSTFETVMIRNQGDRNTTYFNPGNHDTALAEVIDDKLLEAEGLYEVDSPEMLELEKRREAIVVAIPKLGQIDDDTLNWWEFFGTMLPPRFRCSIFRRPSRLQLATCDNLKPGPRGSTSRRKRAMKANGRNQD